MSPDQRCELDLLFHDPYALSPLLLVAAIKAIRASTLDNPTKDDQIHNIMAQLDGASSIMAIRQFNAACRQMIERLGGDVEY
jgi:hypothetical protein